MVRNDTDATFQLLVSVGETDLHGELRCDRELPVTHDVHARHERFFRVDGAVYRRNELWRSLVDRRTGDQVGEELIRESCARVAYAPVGVEVTDAPGSGGPAGPVSRPGGRAARRGGGA